MDVTAQLPEILKRHVPNINFSKQPGRRDNVLHVSLQDDSNIEYKNIFPEILSKNKRIAINVSLEKMPERNVDMGLQS